MTAFADSKRANVGLGIEAATDTNHQPLKTLDQDRMDEILRAKGLTRSSTSDPGDDDTGSPTQGSDRFELEALEEPAQPSPSATRRPSTAPSHGIEVCEHPRFQEEFRRVKLLGRGASAEVWECVRLSDGKDFAVKVVPYRAGGARSGRQVEEHVVREAQILAKMEHPNILAFETAWIETKVWGGADTSGLGYAGMASPMASPKLVCAPPPSPAFAVKRFDSLCLSMDEGSDDDDDSSSEASGASSNGDSNGSTVFFEWHEEVVPQPSQEKEPDERGKSPSSGAFAATGARNSQRPRTASDSPIFGPTRSGSGPVSAAHRRRSSSPPSSSEDLDLCPEYTATLYIQVELCRDTLLGWIEKRNQKCRRPGGPEPGHKWADDAQSIFEQLVAALAHLHGHGCVHRDVKPANILLARDSGMTIKLGDLGLAKMLGAPGEADFHGAPSPPLPHAEQHGGPGGRGRAGTRGDCAVGTPSYASPEQLAGRPVDAATDVYALGLVTAELICPVSTQMERAAVLEGLRVHRELPAAAVEAFPALAKLAVQMTDPEPSERPQAEQILSRITKACRKPGRRSSNTSSADGSATDTADSLGAAAAVVVAGGPPPPLAKGRLARPRRRAGRRAPHAAGPHLGSAGALRRRHVDHQHLLAKTRRQEKTPVRATSGALPATRQPPSVTRSRTVACAT